MTDKTEILGQPDQATVCRGTVGYRPMFTIACSLPVILLILLSSL